MSSRTTSKLDLKELETLIQERLVIRSLLDHDPTPGEVAGAGITGKEPKAKKLKITIYLVSFTLVDTDGNGPEGYVRYYREEPYEGVREAVGLHIGEIFSHHLRESYRSQWLLDGWAKVAPAWLEPKEVVLLKRKSGIFSRIPATNLKLMEHMARLHQEIALRVAYDTNEALLNGIFYRLGAFIRDQDRSWRQILGDD